MQFVIIFGLGLIIWRLRGIQAIARDQLKATLLIAEQGEDAISKE